VIHSHGVIAAFVGILLARIFHKKCIVSIHAIYNLNERPVLARVMRNVLGASDEVLVLAKKSRLELAQAGLDARKIKVFTYWVDQENFRPEAKGQCKDSIGLSGKFMILFVGRLLEIKGVTMVLEIARRLTFENKVAVAIVGDGPCRTEVESAARMLPNLKYAGSVPNKNLDVYYNAADLLLVPSLYEEGYGRVIVEALSCGTPVIASNRGGIPEAVDSSVGLLVEPAVDNFISAIGKLYRDRIDLAEMASNCRPYAEAHFSETNAQIIVDAYQ